MPGRDGKGPISGNGNVNKGRGGGIGAGPMGYCICPKCGEKVAHVTGIPCTLVKCPKCGANMIRG